MSISPFHQSLIGTIEWYSSAPPNPTEGYAYFDSVTGDVMVYTNGNWVSLTPHVSTVIRKGDKIDNLTKNLDKMINGRRG